MPAARWGSMGAWLDDRAPPRWWVTATITLLRSARVHDPVTVDYVMVPCAQCHAPKRFGTVNMEDNVNIEWSWCEGWAQRSLVVAIYCTRRLSWCKRWLPTSSSHHSHKNCQEAEETEGIMSIMVWERNAHFCSPTPIPEWAKKLKNW